MDIAQLAQTRRTCKAYDPNRTIPADQFEQLKTLLRYAPSSVNSQPWHFIVAASQTAKQRLTKATEQGSYSANRAKILNASHVIVLCARTQFDEAHLASLLQQEAQDGRFPTPEGKEMQHRGRSYYMNLHRFDLKDTQHWMEKQVYLALGSLLFGAASLGIDATPIEGFDARALNDELGLRQQGLTSVVLVALGYRSEQDFNAELPKSRLPQNVVISEL
jgi:nitroreductase/dihydropteridine reductase